MVKNAFLLLSGLLILSACSSSDDPVYACPTVLTYPGGKTITGKAVYEYRTNGNGAIAGPNDIRIAEVAIYNSANLLIQCGMTDNNGLFSVIVPESSETNSVRIRARVLHSSTNATIYNNPSNREVHYISANFVPSADVDVGTLTATADSGGELKGGAFNILDKILSANLYLATVTENCSSNFSSCTPFTGAPAVSVFWDKGVNPGAYVGAGPLSFYLSGTSELYILGGEDGDIDSSDTDHFDNSIIVHEYGHFIEDMFSETSSMGGSHNGNTILDARLAWGEGWANFFQAAALNNPVYRDTSGTIAGTTLVFFNEDLETPDNDIPSTLGEGNFREFSITRLLWDAIDPVSAVGTNEGAGVDEVTSTFAELWTAFTAKTSAGIASTSYRFRNVGLFHERQQALPSASDWSSIRTGENHQNTQLDYARTATRGGSCADISIQAANIPAPASAENGTTTNSNQFASNDFYQYFHTGGVLSLQVTYTNSDANNPADLDLYVFKEAYKFSDTSTHAMAPATTHPVVPSAGGTESVAASVAAGYYLINVRVYTFFRLGSTATYSMTLNGAALCPN